MIKLHSDENLILSFDTSYDICVCTVFEKVLASSQNYREVPALTGIAPLQNPKIIFVVAKL